ncbi:hypothetical protein Bbelb_029860 [Branchiostoma belcheri]|nr:hypothetical protein Bbelb_029860 [Branchiostoma belcheri]
MTKKEVTTKELVIPLVCRFCAPDLSSTPVSTGRTGRFPPVTIMFGQRCRPECLSHIHNLPLITMDRKSGMTDRTSSPRCVITMCNIDDSPYFQRWALRKGTVKSLRDQMREELDYIRYIKVPKNVFAGK